MGAKKGHKQSPEHIEKRRLKNLGKKRSDEQKKNISISLKGKYVGDKGSMWGKSPSIESIEKGNKNNFYNKHHTKESIEKIKETQKKNAKLRGYWRTPESIEKQIETRKKTTESNGYYFLPESIEKQIKTRKKTAEKMGYYYSSKSIAKGVETRKKNAKLRGYWCSKEAIEKYRVASSGEKNANWLGGKSFELYSIYWTKALRKSIRERDNYICQLCYNKQSDYNYAFSVHHIDYNKENCDPSNLITLCKKCHQKTNFNREYWQEKLTSMLDSNLEKMHIQKEEQNGDHI